jgi:arylsulfatase A-like enzyme
MASSRARESASGRSARSSAAPSALPGAGFRQRPVAVICVLAGVVACTAETPRPNVLLVSIDTLRADHLGSYGYGRETSPHLDELAREGVRFARAFTTASWTLPAHMSIMTSRYPNQHGVQSRNQRLDAAIPTIAQLFRDSGYETGGIVSWFFVGKRYGFDRGFISFEELLPQRHDLAGARRGEQVVDAALAWLAARDQRRPFFLFVHLFDPHLHYDPPEPYGKLFGGDSLAPDAGRYEKLRPYIKGLQREPRRIPAAKLEQVVALYDGEIRYADDQLGRLLDAVGTQGIDDRTVVMVTSDHGEELDDHGSMEGHQWTLYDEVLHVPLVLRVPAGPRGRTVNDLVEIVDIAPTLLGLAGIEPPPGFRGRSLQPWLVEPQPEAKPRLVFSQIERFNSRSAVRGDRYKLIHTRARGKRASGAPDEAGYELYDLRSDPGEHENLYAQRPEVAAGLRAALERWQRDAPAGDPPSGAPAPAFSAEERAQLERLGYLE